MNYIYEVVDVTDDEVCWTAGVFSSCELALQWLDKPSPIQVGFSDANDSILAKFAVRRRPLDKYSETGRIVAIVQWTALPLEDYDEDQRWARAVDTVDEALTDTGGE